LFTAGALTLARLSAFGSVLVFEGDLKAGLVSIALVFGLAAREGATDAPALAPFAAAFASRSLVLFRMMRSSTNVVSAVSGSDVLRPFCGPAAIDAPLPASKASMISPNLSGVRSS